VAYREGERHQPPSAGSEKSIDEGTTVSLDSFGARAQLNVGDSTFEIYRLDAVQDAARLPYSLKVLLENLLHNEDGRLITAGQIDALRTWDATTTQSTEILFTPARVLMQDFTGVPCVVDLARY
jgi:aconitate hydratase